MQQSYVERMEGNGKLKLGGIDGLTADIIIFLADSENARKFLAKPRIAEALAHNDKIELTDEEYHEFSGRVPNSAKDTHPGGSVFNTFATFSGMNPDDAAIRIVTVLGANLNALNSRKRAKTRGIKFLPEIEVDLGTEMATPVSYVCIEENGKKYLLKHAGSVAEFLKNHPEFNDKIQDSLADTIAWSDLFFLPGGVTKKFSLGTFDFALRKLVQTNTPFIFAAPTHGGLKEEEAKLYKKALDASSLVFGNLDELKITLNAINKLYGKPEITKKEAIKVLTDYMITQYKIGNTSKVAFITDGIHNAYVINANPENPKSAAIVTPIKPLPDPERIVTTLGAGDGSYSGLLHVLKGYPPVVAAKIGMHVSNDILQIAPAQLDHPIQTKEKALAALGNPEANDKTGAAILGSKSKGR